MPPAALRVLSTSHLPPFRHHARGGLAFCVAKDGSLSVRAGAHRLHISCDGLAVSVEEQPTRRRVYSFSNLPARLRPLYSAGERFVSLLRAATPRVSVRAGAATAVLTESEDFVLSVSGEAGDSRCHLPPPYRAATAIIRTPPARPLLVSPSSSRGLPRGQARLLCLAFFLRQECWAVSRRLSDFPVRLGGAALTVDRFVARPAAGWAMRVGGKALFLLLADFSAVCVTRRGRRRLEVRLSLPDGRQVAAEARGPLPGELRRRLGALLILLRAVTERAEESPAGRPGR